MPKVQTAHGDSSQRGRRGRVGRIAPTLSEINVVPLVDVMLVLLIIFMVAAPMMQQGLSVNLPQARRAAAMQEARVTVTVPLSYRQDGRVQINDETVRIDVLAERIRQTLLTATEKQVYVRGDGGVTVQELMDVMDRLKAGGVERVGLLSRPDERSLR
jgi:biopolymer transport protein TolR